MQVQPAAAAPEPLSYIERGVQALVKKIWELIRPIFLWLGWIAKTPPPAPPALPPFPEPVLAPHPPAPEPALPPPVSLEAQILSHLRIGPPSMVLQHFERYVSPPKQAKIYERLGQEAEISARDRVLNLWRDSAARLVRTREIGMEEARLNPYRLIPYLEKALQKKIAQT